MIAFRVGDRPDLIDAVFRRSALYREKWERDDYRDSTVGKAIAFTKERLADAETDSEKVMPPFVVVSARGNESISAPLLLQYTKEHLRFLMVKAETGEEIRVYVYRDGVYQLFDRLMFEGEMRKFISAYDDSLSKVSVLEEAWNLLMMEHDRCIDPQELNSCQDLINFENGLLRLTGGKPVLLPHTPDVFSTIRIPCRWEEKGISTPVFDAFLNTLCSGDEDIQRLLIEFIGVALSCIPGYKTKKSLFLVGPGNTGKSLFRSLLEAILGKKNCISIDLREMENRFGTGYLDGKRLAGSADMSFLNVQEMSVFKNLTGGDSVFAEAKFEKGFSFRYSGLLCFCMNRLPKFGGDNGPWVYERIMPVECLNVIPPQQRDPYLLEKLCDEKEGIVQKAVGALCSVIERGCRFSEPDSVRSCLSRYREENSSVSSFYYECMCRKSTECRADEDLTVMTVYSAYREYCKTNNNGFCKQKKDFHAELAGLLGYGDPEAMFIRRSIGKVYVDYTLTPEARALYCRSYFLPSM